MFKNCHMILIVIIMLHILYYRYLETTKIKACNEFRL